MLGNSSACSPEGPSNGDSGKDSAPSPCTRYGTPSISIVDPFLKSLLLMVPQQGRGPRLAPPPAPRMNP